MARKQSVADVERKRVFMAGVLAERDRVLKIINNTPQADLQDGRDLVVRTDIIRKVEYNDSENR